MSEETEWRRQWKPDLKSRGWMPIEFTDTTTGSRRFLVKCLFEDNSYEIMLTDLINVWYELLDEENFRKRNKALNPNMEAPIETLLDHIKLNMEEKQENTKYSLNFVRPLFNIDEGEESKIVLTISGLLSGVPYVWKFHFRHGEDAMLCEHMTKPLLAMVAELNRRQQQLITLLKNKDNEIEDYRMQGYKTTRKHIATTSFDEAGFKTEMAVSKGFEEEMTNYMMDAFNPDTRELYQVIMEKQAYIHRPTETAQQENETEPSASGDANADGSSWGNSRLPPSLLDGIASSTKSPEFKKGVSSTESTPVKDEELERREMLKRRLEEEEEKKQEKLRKKKKKTLF